MYNVHISEVNTVFVQVNGLIYSKIMLSDRQFRPATVK